MIDNKSRAKGEKEIEIGATYKHYKGRIYRIIGIAVHTETEEKLVVYQDIACPEKVWARPFDMFCDRVGDRPRFLKLSLEQNAPEPSGDA